MAYAPGNAVGLADAMTRDVRVTLKSIPSGDAGARATAREMATIARTYQLNPLVRQTAVELTRGVAARDYAGDLVALRTWLASHLRFKRDPGEELLHTPDLLLRWIQQQGVAYVDCDDAALLAAALGKAIGLKARFVVVGFLSPAAPYAHVWAELAAPIGDPEWMEFDVTRQAQRIDPAVIARRFTITV